MLHQIMHDKVGIVLYGSMQKLKRWAIKTSKDINRDIKRLRHWLELHFFISFTYVDVHL